MVAPTSHKVSRVPWYLGTISGCLWISFTRLSRSMVSHSKLFYYPQTMPFIDSPVTPYIAVRFRLLRVRSPLLTESHTISFPPATEMFHFTGCPSLDINVEKQSRLREIRFPHSETVGSKLLSQLPDVYRLTRDVLPRPCIPRHPPLALAVSSGFPVRFGRKSPFTC